MKLKWEVKERAAAMASEVSSGPPKDVFNLAYLVYFSLGAGLLLPWNAFITAVDYFDFLYPDSHIDRIFSISYIFPCFTVLCLLTLYGQRYTAKVRINSGLSLYLACIVLVVFLDAVFIGGDKKGSSGTFYATVGALVVTGVSDGLVQGSLVGSASQLPARYVQGVVSGTAVSGVLISVLRIVTKAALPQTPSGLRISGNVYFGVAAAFLAFCLVAFNFVHKLPVMVYYEKQKRQRQRSGSVSAETERLTSRQDLEGEVNVLENVMGLTVTPPAVGKSLVERDKCTLVMGKVKWLAGSLTLVYVVTLAIFPGFITEDVHSVSLGDWYPVVLMTAYNVFDLVGKLLTPLYYPKNSNWMVGGSVGRLLLIPLFAGCLQGPRFFRTEGPVVLLTSLLGITNGYFTSCLFIVAPTKVPSSEAETAGIFMVISLVLGLAIGSVVSWFWEV